MLTVNEIISGYQSGRFPMGDSNSDCITWHQPELRGTLPIAEFHVPSRLRRSIRKNLMSKNSMWNITLDTAFYDVMHKCAEPQDSRPSTWITNDIVNVYGKLHTMGLAHSVEVWASPNEVNIIPKLVGGLYGVAINGAFFGESMFSIATDASKIALVQLMSRLRHGGFVLCDIQFFNRHFYQFGEVVIPCDDYLDALRVSSGVDASWLTLDEYDEHSAFVDML